MDLLWSMENFDRGMTMLLHQCSFVFVISGGDGADGDVEMMQWEKRR